MFFFATNRSRAPVETELPESEWVRRAADGDEDAFVQLARLYRDRVWNTASRFARGRAELEDLTQDLFLKIWKGLPGYRDDAPFEHWLMRVTVRGCYDFLRKHRRRREREVLNDPAEDYATQDPAAARRTEQREAWEVVSCLLERLDPRDRTVITLLDLEERSVREVAEVTGWSESNVKVRAHRARKKMRTIYESLETRPETDFESR